MKQNFTLLFLITFFVIGHCQEKENPSNHYPISGPYMAREITEMPVISGCDVNPKNKKEQTICITKQLQTYLNNIFSGDKELNEYLNENDITNVKSKLQFVFGRQGEILYIKLLKINSENHPIFDELCLKAMNQIISKIEPFEPAKLEDGSKVNIVFELPVIYKIQ